MTVKAVVNAGRLVEAEGQHKMLRALIDWPALRRLGWDPKREIFAPVASDPVFGFVECHTACCDQVSGTNRWGLCCGCMTRWRRSCPEASLEEFCQVAPPRAVKQGGGLCLVCRSPGHERPTHWQGLCGACVSTMGQRGQDVAGYISGDGEFGPAAPRLSFGYCQVATCERWAAHREPALCEAHYISWVRRGQHTGQALGAWCGRQRALDYDGRTVVLRGLGERAQLEVLYGLWCRARAERRTTPRVVQMAVNLLWAAGAASVCDLTVHHIHDERRLFVIFTARPAELGDGNPGHRSGQGRLGSAGVRTGGQRLALRPDPPAMAEAGGQGVGMRTSRRTAGAVGHLERRRPSPRPVLGVATAPPLDRGCDPAVLCRADMLAFCNDLAHLEAAGRVSRQRRGSLLAMSPSSCERPAAWA